MTISGLYVLNKYLLNSLATAPPKCGTEIHIDTDTVFTLCAAERLY